MMTLYRLLIDIISASAVCRLSYKVSWCKTDTEKMGFNTLWYLFVFLYRFTSLSVQDQCVKKKVLSLTVVLDEVNTVSTIPRIEEENDSCP